MRFLRSPRQGCRRGRAFTAGPHRLCRTCGRPATPRASVVQQQQDNTAPGKDVDIRVQATKRIKSLGEAGRAREAVSELAQMARLGVQPDTQAGTALLHACTRNGQIDMAQTVFEELFGTLLQPDDVTFSILLKGYGSCEPPRWMAITSLLQTMDSKYNIQPSTTVYNCLLDICARTNDQERGYDIIDRMSRARIVPNKYTLKAVKDRKALRSYLKRTLV